MSEALRGKPTRAKSFAEAYKNNPRALALIKKASS